MPPSIARKADFFVLLRLVLRSFFMCHGCGGDSVAFAFATEAAEAADDSNCYKDRNQDVPDRYPQSRVFTEGFAVAHYGLLSDKRGSGRPR